MLLKLRILFLFYKKHLVTLTIATLVLLLLPEKGASLPFIITIKFIYFLVLKIWYSLVSYTNIEVSFTDQFFFYENLGIHHIHLFAFGFIFDSLTSVTVFYAFQYLKTWF
ncbi:hypothetical protein [uncultured Aquimarina sp.]|uniref:hypothetical protein n=1 Tax=uncultured Aquimarina sp. TaxID=575652 RepID=UPI002632888C|nr:hypothetical protein [uncultured Aquimarina sp.]